MMDSYDHAAIRRGFQVYQQVRDTHSTGHAAKGNAGRLQQAGGFGATAGSVSCKQPLGQLGRQLDRQ